MVSLSEDLGLFEHEIVTSSDSNKSIVLCTRMLKICPDKSVPYSLWALRLLKQRQHSKAKQKFLKSIQISPNNVDRYDDWLEGLYYAREFEEVILLAERDSPNKFEFPHLIQNTVGVCFLHLGDYENAIKCFQKAISIKADYELAYFNWALALYLQGNKEEALEMNERAYKIRPLRVTFYPREVRLLKEDLEREENKIFEDFIKTKIEGFEFFIERDRAKRRGD